MDDETISDLFAGLGPVSIRRMFGGKGIYHHGLIIAVVLRGELLLKGDSTTADELEAAGARRWITGSKGRRANMPYWSVPEAALDDPDEMTRWARLALEAAIRSKAPRTEPL